MRTWKILTTVALFVAPITGCDSTEAPSERRALARGLAEAKFSLAEAIEIARSEVPAATLRSADFEIEAGVARYEVELVADGDVHELEIDHITGRILDRDVDPSAASSGMTLPSGLTWSTFLETAQLEAGGIAFEAKRSSGSANVRVEVFAGDIIYAVELDEDGEVVDVEECDDWEEDEEEEEEEDEEDDGGGGGDDDDDEQDDGGGGGEDDDDEEDDGGDDCTCDDDDDDDEDDDGEDDDEHDDDGEDDDGEDDDGEGDDGHDDDDDGDGDDCDDAEEGGGGDPAPEEGE